MQIQKVSLIGLGAMGSFFAPKLNAALGAGNFRVIAGGERKKRLQTKGVVINGVNYHFTVTAPEETGEPADLIIMAVKYPALDGAIDDIKNQVGENTQILCVMNGIDSEERVAAVYGWEHVLYSFMRVSIEMKDGVADYDPAVGSVHFGEAKNEQISPRVQAIKDLFDRCGISYQVENDMLRGLWFKYMCNVGENMTCALLGIPFGAFRHSEDANFIRRGGMSEVLAVANRLGIDLNQTDMDRQEETLKNLPYYNRPSTLQDLENGRKTEIEMFAGKMVEMGEKLGISTPINKMFFHGIKVLEAKALGRLEPQGDDLKPRQLKL